MEATALRKLRDELQEKMSEMRLSLCNEVLAELPFAGQCAYAAALGYAGLEVAPYTLADDPTRIGESEARRLAGIAADHGLVISGLHWLLVAPKGLSITSADPAQRARTIAAMQRLVTLCAALGGSYLVHGSPGQRRLVPGQSKEAALAAAIECWAKAASVAATMGLTYCIEPLSPDQTPLVNTIEEAIAIVQGAALPSLKTMLDTSSAGLSESLPIPDLIDRYWPSGALAHVQLNDRNRRAPGQGDDRFAPVLAALRRNGYQGWLAIEPFDYRPDGRGSAAFAAGYVKGLLERCEGG